MMLQSLVENAIKHGLEPKPEGGALRVDAEVVHGKLVVTVADTGVGFGAPRPRERGPASTASASASSSSTARKPSLRIAGIRRLAPALRSSYPTELHDPEGGDRGRRGADARAAACPPGRGLAELEIVAEARNGARRSSGSPPSPDVVFRAWPSGHHLRRPRDRGASDALWRMRMGPEIGARRRPLDRLGAVARLGHDLELGPDLGQAGTQLLRISASSSAITALGVMQFCRVRRP